jgi:hypothetical protein
MGRRAVPEEKGEAHVGEAAVAALADARNERIVKQASFRACWEDSPGASGRIGLRIVVDSGGGVSVHAVPGPLVPETVVSCAATRARGLALRIPLGSGPRTFEISSSFAPQLM